MQHFQLQHFPYVLLYWQATVSACFLHVSLHCSDVSHYPLLLPSSAGHYRNITRSSSTNILNHALCYFHCQCTTSMSQCITNLTLHGCIWANAGNHSSYRRRQCSAILAVMVPRNLSGCINSMTWRAGAHALTFATPVRRFAATSTSTI